ncbi:MAG: general secretion pathway protein GspK [Bdellovibrionota bacterium]
MKNKLSQKNKFAKSKGVALLLTTFIIALVAILIVNLSYSTMITSQQNTNLTRATQAEYLLKSAESLAIVLLNNDANSYDAKHFDLSTSLSDAQAIFATPQDVSNFLEIPIDGVKISMQLVPCNAYLNFSNLDRDIKRQQILTTLFDALMLENIEGEFTSELLQNSNNTNEQLVANIADYLDAGNEDCENCVAKGIESQIHDKNIRKLWDSGTITNFGVLYTLPRFNMNKVNAIAPYFCINPTANSREYNLNLNYVSTELLNVLAEYASKYQSANIDVNAIISRQNEDVPFTSPNDIMQFFSQLGIEADKVFSNNFFTTSSHYWELIASVSIGNSTSRVRSIIQKGAIRPNQDQNQNQDQKQNQNGARVIDRELIF